MAKKNIVAREEWGARPRLLDDCRYKEADLPVKFVFFEFKTGPPCQTADECCAAVRRIQDEHMDQRGLVDIAYNFLIGGDGRVYEGRGWTFRPDRSLSRPWTETHKKRYDFAYIGEHDDFDKNVPAEMFTKSMDHVFLGVKYVYIHEKFEMHGGPMGKEVEFTKEHMDTMLVKQHKLKKTDEIN